MFISPMDFFKMQHLTVSLIESQGDKSTVVSDSKHIFYFHA